MKTEYISPEIEIITFDCEDVILNSQESGETHLASSVLPNRLIGEDPNDYKQYKDN